MLAPQYAAGRRELARLTVRAVIFGLLCGGVVLYLLAPERTHR